MDNETLQLVVNEILPILQTRIIGKIFQLERNQLAIDFRPGDGRYLFLNFEPNQSPRLYLIRRRVKELEKNSDSPSNFVQFTRKRLSNALLMDISKDADDRIIRFAFLAEDENFAPQRFSLIAQFAGRSANLFLLDANDLILDSLRESNGAGQEVNQVYSPPKIENSSHDSRSDKKPILLEKARDFVKELKLEAVDSFVLTPPSPLSKTLDDYFSALELTQNFETNAKNARAILRQDLTKKERLLSKLQKDVNAHGKAETSKKLGDLLLANIATAKISDNKVTVIDYFDENAPEVTFEIDENLSLPENAEKFFARYAKARNAANALTSRIEDLQNEIVALKNRQTELEAVVETGNAARLLEFIETHDLTLTKTDKKPENKGQKKKEPEKVAGARVYRSSDGLEILVGRASRDNDFITFRVSKSLDWWFHAADYSGSHVIVRNPGKGELPPKTLLEAAELAAKFSHANKNDDRISVRYTQRKFVSKPKHAAPGMVSLASFRTILVEPKESATRIKT